MGGGGGPLVAEIHYIKKTFINIIAIFNLDFLFESVVATYIDRFCDAAEAMWLKTAGALIPLLWLINLKR